MNIGVDCRFSANGSVRVRRIAIGKEWQDVGQGRQWLDQDGRHVLIMLPNQETREIVLRPDTMAWEMLLSRRNVHVA